MLSFRDVHIGDTAMACPPSNGTPTFYRPGDIAWAPPPSTGGPTTPGDAPTADAQRLFYLASCPPSVVPGAAVYVTGTNAVDTADNARPDPVVGIVTSKRSPTLAVVQTAGEIVLGLAGLSPGVDYFLGNDGGLRAPPLGGVLFVQRVGVATTATRLYLHLDGHIVRQGGQ